MKKFAFIILILFALAACVSKPAPKPEADIQTENQPAETAASQPIAPTILDTPKRNDIEDRLLDVRLIENVEIGSPASLRAAVSFIANDPKGLTDTNRLYLVLISEIMERLYPHEQITWNIPNYNDTNKYLSAFATIDGGMQAQNLDESTFLSLVIPCFYAVRHNITDSELAAFDARLKKCEALSKRSVLPSYLRGIMYEKLGKLSTARNSYKAAYSMDSSCTEAGLCYARLLSKTGNSRAAFEIMQGLDNLKETVPYQLTLAETYIALKNYEQASDIIVSILTRNPDNSDAVLIRIKILIATNEYLKANALLDAFATKDKTNKDYLLLRSELFLQWNKSTSSALGVLTDAYAKYPNDFDVLLACAQICFQTGQSIQGVSAEQFIEKVTAQDAANIQATALLVQEALGNEQWNLAVQKAEALVAQSNTPENNYLLVRAYLGAGRIPDALKLATDLYNAAPDNVEITSVYLAALQKSGAASQLVNIINTKMPAANDSLKAVLYYYQATISSGETRLSYLRSSLLSDPRNQDALFAMYQYYYNAGDYPKAEYYLKQVIAVDPLNKRNMKLLKALQNR